MKTLLSQIELQEGVARLAREITDFYRGRPLTIVGVLTGSVVLLADLIRSLEMPLRVGVVQASSYRGGTERGELVVNYDLLLDLRDREVLLVDDIFDTGLTLEALVERLSAIGPASLRTAVLLEKTGRRKSRLLPDFRAFEIPDQFVVGYGLDYRDAYRNLPYVAYLEPEDLAGLTP